MSGTMRIWNRAVLCAGILVSTSVSFRGSAETEEYIVLPGEGEAYALRLDATVTRVAESKAFGGLVRRYCAASDGTVIQLNPSPTREGLYSGAVIVDRILRDSDFQVRKDPRWAAYDPSCLALSPDEQTLAFCAIEVDPGRPGYHQWQVYWLDLQSGQVTCLTSWDGDAHHVPMNLSWAPDSRAVALYCAPDSRSQDPSSGAFELHAIAMGGKEKVLAEPCQRPARLGALTMVGPFWAADSTTVFFVGNYESGDKAVEEGFPLTYAASVQDVARKRLCLGTPTSVTPDGRFLFSSVQSSRSAYLRTEIATETSTDLGKEWMHAMVSRSGRYVASFPPGGHVNVWSISGERVLRVDADNLPVIPFVGSAFWVIRQ